jgi:hypothetical protein
MIEIIVNMNRKRMKLIQFVTFIQNLAMIDIKFGAGTGDGTGTASRCGSGSIKMKWLLAAPHHCFLIISLNNIVLLMRVILSYS